MGTLYSLGAFVYVLIGPVDHVTAVRRNLKEVDIAASHQRRVQLDRYAARDGHAVEIVLIIHVNIRCEDDVLRVRADGNVINRRVRGQHAGESAPAGRHGPAPAQAA